MAKAFIVGNGPSRTGFNLESLRDKGTIFGCNALYKVFRPDYLIAIDEWMITEIEASDYPSHRVIIPMENERYELSGTGRRSNAGTNGMIEAIRRGFNVLYCLGFDFLIKDPKLSIGNVFDGHSGYELARRATYEDNINRVSYLQWLATKHQNVKFYFVFPRQEMELHDIFAGNVMGVFYEYLNG